MILGVIHRLLIILLFKSRDVWNQNPFASVLLEFYGGGGERNPLLLLLPHTHAAPTKAKYYACRTEMTALVSMMALEFANFAPWPPQHPGSNLGPPLYQRPRTNVN